MYNWLNCRIDKAAGADGLCSRLLPETKQEISYPLFIRFRQSLDEASVPRAVNTGRMYVPYVRVVRISLDSQSRRRCDETVDFRRQSESGTVEFLCFIVETVQDCCRLAPIQFPTRPNSTSPSRWRRPSDHYFRIVSVCLSVCLCRDFLSRL